MPLTGDPIRDQGLMDSGGDHGLKRSDVFQGKARFKEWNELQGREKLVFFPKGIPGDELWDITDGGSRTFLRKF